MNLKNSVFEMSHLTERAFHRTAPSELRLFCDPEQKKLGWATWNGVGVFLQNRSLDSVHQREWWDRQFRMAPIDF